MRPDSPLYNYRAKQLEELIDSYPLEFPDQLRSDLRREVRSTKLRMNGMLASMVGFVTGAIFCRGKAWYVLTGRNSLPALYYVFGNFYSFSQYDRYFQAIQLRIFANNHHFERVNEEHNIGPKSYLF